MSESSPNGLPPVLKFFGSIRKCLENFRNPRKIFECNWKFTRNFYNIPIWHLWTEDQIKEYWFVICTGITLFALVLHFLHWCYSFICTALSQSESSNFFMYVIILETTDTSSAPHVKLTLRVARIVLSIITLYISRTQEIYSPNGKYMSLWDMWLDRLFSVPHREVLLRTYGEPTAEYASLVT